MALERPWLERANRTYSSPLSLGATRVVGVLGTLSVTLLAASMMSADEFGRLAVLLAIAQLVAIPLASLQAPVLRTVANAEERGGLFRGTLTLVARHGAVQLMIGAAIGLVFSRYTEISGANVVTVLLLGVLLGGMQVIQAARRGLGDFLFGQAPFEMVRPLIACLLMLCGLLLLDRTAETALHAILIATVLSAGCFLALRGLDQAAPRCPDLSPSTVTWFLAATVGTSFIGRIEVIIVGLMLGSAQAGGLALALRLGQLGAFGISLAGFRYAGDLSAAFARSDGQAVQAVINKVTTVGVAFGFPVGIVMCAAPGLLLRPFGEATPERLAAIVIVGVALLINTTFGPTMMVMTMTGLERSAAVGQLAGATTAIIISFTLGGTAVAGAIGYACAITLWNAYFAFQLRRKFHFSTSMLGAIQAWRDRQRTPGVEASV